MVNIALIGDSLTNRCFENGWGNFLKKNYNCNVLNKSFDGFTSRRIKNMISSLIYTNDIDIATILLGTNDCFLPNNNKIPPDEYKSNILHIIYHLNNYNKNCKILIITPPISQEGKKHIDVYANKICEIYYENKNQMPNLSLINLYESPNEIQIADLSDAVHFNINASNKLFNKIKSEIDSKYKHLF